tara:strand:- start:370 stop:741 length:372 start_codon:yes stop_codon:yes gene_type:complete
MSGKNVLLIGLDPDVVNYERWPGLTADKLVKGFQADAAKFKALGHEASVCFVDHGQTAEATVGEALSKASYDCILIGAGVRTDPDEFLLFEKLVNVVHVRAPAARICFNTGPTDSVDAVLRWL